MYVDVTNAGVRSGMLAAFVGAQLSMDRGQRQRFDDVRTMGDTYHQVSFLLPGLAEAMREAGREHVVLLDGLDRVHSSQDFMLRVELDLQLLRGDLAKVIEQRAGEAFTPDALEMLVPASGGVLRDLVALAQRCCEEAYVDGADVVATEHVEVATRHFGERLLLGLDSADAKTVQRILTEKKFVITQPADLALLASRRVLEYGPPGREHYVVHPALARVLESAAA